MKLAMDVSADLKAEQVLQCSVLRVVGITLPAKKTEATSMPLGIITMPIQCHFRQSRADPYRYRTVDGLDVGLLDQNLLGLQQKEVLLLLQY